MKNRLVLCIVCLAMIFAFAPNGFAPRAEAAAITAEQTLQERRQAAFDYMMSMATVMWRATEDVTYTYGTSTANIKAGRLYRGIPYTYGRGDLATFMDFAGEPDEKGVYSVSGLTTQHLDGYGLYARIGNDCSGAANAAYGSIGASVNVAGSSSVVPDQGYPRVALDKYTTKPSDSTNSDGKDVCVANGEQVMYSVYAEAQIADLWVCSGHTMMQHYSQIVYNEDGTIDGEKSVAYIVHQTPAPIRNESYYTSGPYSEANYGEKVYKTMEADVTRTFKWLYDNGYMPVTCAEFTDVNAAPSDVTLRDSISDYSLATITQGTLTANRMIDSATITITTPDGEVLQKCTAYTSRYRDRSVNAELSVDLYQFAYENPEKMNGTLNLNLLGVGNYHCTTTVRLRTGEILTARDFDFEVTEADLCAGWVDNSNLTSANSMCPVCKVEVQWQPLTAISETTSLSGGHYYLTGDIDSTAYYNIMRGTNCIHLNGHNMNSSTLTIRIGDATLNMMGNGKVTGSFNDSTAKYGSTLYLQDSEARLNLYGGTYGHNADTTRATIGMFLPEAQVAMYGGATICRMDGAKGPNVYVGKGSFDMYGGLITDGDNRKNFGGNIKVGDDTTDAATFTQHGGIIACGRAKNGGNVHIDGANSNFVQEEAGGILLGMAGYITKDGVGGNLYMDLGGTAVLNGSTTLVSCYAGGANVYAKKGQVSVGGVVAHGIADNNSEGGKSGGNIWLGEGAQLTVSGTVRDNLAAVSNGGNIFASAASITIDGGVVSGGRSTSRGGNIYMTATAPSLTVKNDGMVLDGYSKNGGNIATNSADAVIDLQSATVTGGSADENGGEIRLFAAAKLNLAEVYIGGEVYGGAGTVELTDSAKVIAKENLKDGCISFSASGKLVVKEGWSGTAAVKWDSEYAQGEAVPEARGKAEAPFDGKLYQCGQSGVRVVTASQDGILTIGNAVYTVTFLNADGTVLHTGIYEAGEALAAPADPTKEEDADNTYTFAGWDKNVEVATGDAVYTAVFTAIPKTPVVTKDGWVQENGIWYFYEDGTMVKDAWRKDSKGWCYLGADGAMLTNQWKKDSKGWCYIDGSGYIVYNKWVKDSKGWCYVDAGGYMVYNKWIRDAGKWYYLDGAGYMVTNRWQKDSKGWCYLQQDGSMAVNKWVKDSKGWCYVGADGYAVTNCWKKDSKGWIYLDSNGSMSYSKWIKDDGKWYYVDSTGYMVASRSMKISGKTYNFNASGVCTNP